MTKSTRFPASQPLASYGLLQTPHPRASKKQTKGRDAHANRLQAAKHCFDIRITQLYKSESQTQFQPYKRYSFYVDGSRLKISTSNPFRATPIQSEK